MFFFQAEDGIRDLVRSRGLGDVYKRQEQHGLGLSEPGEVIEVAVEAVRKVRVAIACTLGSVSYTHLTLPTSDLV